MMLKKVAFAIVIDLTLRLIRQRSFIGRFAEDRVRAAPHLAWYTLRRQLR